MNDINRELANKQMEPIYTMQKLEQWQGNALYRYRCIQRNQKPESWQGSHARAAVPGRGGTGVQHAYLLSHFTMRFHYSVKTDPK